jgi:hypothetical protein
MRVTVVFDKDLGARAEPRVGDAFWLIESTSNRGLAERLWGNGAADPNSAVFKDGGSPSDDAVSLLDTIDLHHPEWTEIEFVGAPLTESSRRSFVADGMSVVETEWGFLLTR